MNLPETVESLIKDRHEMTVKDIWWELRETDPEHDKVFQTTFTQMMNQIKLLVKENKIMLVDDGTYIWIEASEKLKKSLGEAVQLK